MNTDQHTLVKVVHALQDARDDFLTHSRTAHTGDAWIGFGFGALTVAVQALGYRLVPLTQDKNDSGRLSEVPDDEQERFHRAVTEGSARLEEGAAYGKDGL